MSEETRTGTEIEQETTVSEDGGTKGQDLGAEAIPQQYVGAEQAGSHAGQQTLPTMLPEEQERRALLEAIIYVAEEPLSLEQVAAGLAWPPETVGADLEKLIESYSGAERGVEIRVVAGGYKMFTKPEHHEAVRGFVKTLKPKLKLSLPALETLAVIAYKQPITIPEIQAIRGVNVAGVVSTLLNRKLITTAGRKKVIGKPMLYRTTKEFLVQFGLADLSELPNLKELEELSRAALGEGELNDGQEEPVQKSNADPVPADKPSEARTTELKEMVSAIDRTVHGGAADEADASEPVVEPEEPDTGERGGS